MKSLSAFSSLRLVTLSLLPTSRFTLAFSFAAPLSPFGQLARAKLIPLPPGKKLPTSPPAHTSPLSFLPCFFFPWLRSSASLRLSAVPIPSAPHFCRDRRGHYICRRRAAVGPARTARKKLVSDLISFPSFRRSQFSIFFCKSPSSERDPSGRAPGPARILSGCKDRLDRMRRRRLGTDSEGGEGARTGGATPEPFVALESEERSPQRGREREKERGRESRGGVPAPPLSLVGPRGSRFPLPPHRGPGGPRLRPSPRWFHRSRTERGSRGACGAGRGGIRIPAASADRSD